MERAATVRLRGREKTERELAETAKRRGREREGQLRGRKASPQLVESAADCSWVTK